MDELEQACEQVAVKLGGQRPNQMQVVDLLQRHDDRLHQALHTLAPALLAWHLLATPNGLASGTRSLTDHINRLRLGDGLWEQLDDNVATALCDVTDALADDGIQRSAQQLADQILAEVRAETRAYKSLARLRLRRLLVCIKEWLGKDFPGNDEEMLPLVCAELLLLCDHLGITGKQAAGGAA